MSVKRPLDETQLFGLDWFWFCSYHCSFDRRKKQGELQPTVSRWNGAGCSLFLRFFKVYKNRAWWKCDPGGSKEYSALFGNDGCQLCCILVAKRSSRVFQNKWEPFYKKLERNRSITWVTAGILKAWCLLKRKKRLTLAKKVRERTHLPRRQQGGANNCTCICGAGVECIWDDSSQIHPTPATLWKCARVKLAARNSDMV